MDERGKLLYKIKGKSKLLAYFDLRSPLFLVVNRRCFVCNYPIEVVDKTATRNSAQEVRYDSCPEMGKVIESGYNW